MKKETLEKLAEAQHEIWSHWMKYLFSKCGVATKTTDDGEIKYDGKRIPLELAERWIRQMNTPYEELSEKEKNSDRMVVFQFIEPILEEEK